MERAELLATRALVRPCVLVAVALLVVNDHVLKSAAPGVVTGKLSDFAGLAFFPLLLAAAAEMLGVRRGMRTIVIATIATGVVFASIKLSVSAGDVYRVVQRSSTGYWFRVELPDGTFAWIHGDTVYNHQVSRDG